MPDKQRQPYDGCLCFCFGSATFGIDDTVAKKKATKDKSSARVGVSLIHS